MSKFSQEDREKLLSNPNIHSLSKTQVIYSQEFKLHAVKKRLEGVPYRKIFEDAGIDLSFFDYDHPRSRIRDWTQKLNEEGVEGFSKDRRGKLKEGRPRKKYDPKNLQSTLEHLAFLEEENRFLKKLHALATKYRR